MKEILSLTTVLNMAMNKFGGIVGFLGHLSTISIPLRYVGVT